MLEGTRDAQARAAPADRKGDPGVETVPVTRIRAKCPQCGEVDLRPHDIQLEIVRTYVGEVADGSNYRFACPDCEEMVTKPADERIARLLATGGVPITVTGNQVDRLLNQHPEFPPDGPPLTHDDVLEFHLLLEHHSWFEQLQALTPLD